MSILAISHQMGSGGSEIAQLVATRIGYQVAGPKEFAELVERHGLTADRATRLGEAKPALLERLSAETRLYLAMIQAALYEFAEQDDVVILGRGGQWLLRDIPHALRLRVIAPFDARVKHVCLALAHGGQPANPDAVRHLVRRDDVDKRGRARYLFDSELDDAALYDLVLNMDQLDTAGAAAAIERLLTFPEFKSSPAGAQMVADRSLASRVRAALAAVEDTRHHRVDVEASAGVVSLTGMTGLAEAAAVAGRVPGARSVETHLVEILPIPPLM